MPVTQSFPELEINAFGTEAQVFNVASLELTSKLQTTLNCERLLHLFAEEAQKFVVFDGLIFSSPLGYSAKWGTRTQAQASYRLRLHEQMLGELKFYRRRGLGEEDRIMLEYLLCALLYPLQNAQLYQQAIKNALLDALTGVHNRGAFDSSLEREMDLAKRHGIALSLLMIDLDNFKTINDGFGHATGDNVLKNVVQVIEHCSRRSDLLFRFGGEEFVLLLRNTTIKGGLRLAERIRKQIQLHVFEFESQVIPVTVSIGVSGLEYNDTEDLFFKRADAALYRAKQNGKNQVQRVENTPIAAT